MNASHKKRKCMIFSKTVKTMLKLFDSFIANTKNSKFTINSKIIENTKEFKYLGISINSKDWSFKPTLSDLISKANKAIYSLLSWIPIKVTPVKTMLKLFDSFIA